MQQAPKSPDSEPVLNPRKRSIEDVLISLTGIGSGGGDAIGREHNRHLYGSPNEKTNLPKAHSK